MSYRQRSHDRSRRQRNEDHVVDDDDEIDQMTQKLQSLGHFQLNFKHGTFIQTSQKQQSLEHLESNDTPQFIKKHRSRTYLVASKSSRHNQQNVSHDIIISSDNLSSLSSSNDDVFIDSEINTQEINVRENILSKYKNSFFNEKIKDFNENKSPCSPSAKKRVRCFQQEIVNIVKLPSFPSSLSQNLEPLSLSLSNSISVIDNRASTHTQNGYISQKSLQGKSQKTIRSNSRFTQRQSRANETQNNQLYSVEFKQGLTPLIPSSCYLNSYQNNQLQSSQQNSYMYNQESSKSRLIDTSDISLKIHPNTTKQVSLLQNRVSDEVESMKNQPKGDDIPFNKLQQHTQHKDIMVLVPIKKLSFNNLYEVPTYLSVSPTLVKQNQQSQDLIRESQEIPVNQSTYTIDIPLKDSESQRGSPKIRLLDAYSDVDLLNKIIQSIYKKNLKDMKELLLIMQKEYRTDVLNMKDDQGNTPFFLSIKLAYQCLDYFEIAKLFLFHGADPSMKDNYGWAPIEETVAQMDIQSSSLLFDYLVRNKQREFQKNRYAVDQQLQNIDDFYLEIKWEFNSTLIPFFSKMAPSDIFKLHKKGTSLRLDQTFAGLQNYKAKRRDITLLYNPYELEKQRKENQRDCQYIVVVNKSKKHFFYPLVHIIHVFIKQQIDPEEKKQILFDLLNCENVSGQMKFTNCSLQKTKNIFGNYVETQVGDWLTQKYDFKVTVDQQFQRKNHKPLLLNYDQYVLKNLNEQSKLTSSLAKSLDQQSRVSFRHLSQSIFKSSKSSPKKQFLMDQDSLKSDSKNKTKTCAIYLSDKFPLRFEQFMPIIRLLAKGNHLMQSLEQLLEENVLQKLLMSDGFPVRVEIPVTFSIEAIVTFQAYRKLDEGNSLTSLFQIPENIKQVHRKLAQKTMEREKKRLLLANLFL